MCVDLFGVDLSFGFFFCLLFFFPTLKSPAQLHTTYLLGPTYQLRTNSPPLPTYLLVTPPKLVMSFLLIYLLSLLPTYLPNTYITSTTTNENNSNVGIAFNYLALN
jgi:hypothetical protein